ncbi:MAG: carboxypeptidase-like regulatory domain-containing protein [Chitinophagaceae bacterium]
MNTTTTRLKGTFTLILFFLFMGGFAQTGKIVGRLTSAKRGDNVSGATVSIQGTDRRTSSDLEGKFVFSNVPVGNYILEFSSMGFQKKAVSEIEVKGNEVATLEVLLEEQARSMDNIVIKATPRRMETVNALLVRQKNLPNISDGISAESIKRSPDNNTSEVLKRVSGATIQENKYVVVRGLADRYNVAILNNAILPSTEADRRVFSFDIIPSILIDNLQIYKTASPDLPGDFAGGIVQVNTQDVPNKRTFNISAGLGFNTISTGKDFRMGFQGNLDYLGFEAGERRLPAGLPNLRSIVNTDELIAQSQRPNNIFGDRFTGKALPIQNYQFSWAEKFELKNGGSLGTILALTYHNEQHIQYSERLEYADQGQLSDLLFDYRDTIYKFSTNIGAMANIAYKKGNTKIAFKNLLNRLMDVNNLIREGYNNDNLQFVRASSNETNIKTLLSSQIEGEHVLGSKRGRLDWNMNFAFTGGEQPDYRISPFAKNLNDLDDKSVPFKVILRDSYRFFSELNDFAYGALANYSMPFKWKNGEKNTFKAGGSFLYKTRDYAARAFRYKPAVPSIFNPAILSLAPEFVFDPSYMSPQGLVLDEITNNSDAYTGQSQTLAGYAMLDNRLSSKLRLVWGLRVENFSYTVNTGDFSTANIKLNKN